MSSIISDIFYGSKQNLLDNYLIHRFDKEPSLSHQQLQQRTALYSSALHFIITIPVSLDNQQRCYSIKVQLGKKVEEVIATVGGNKKKSEIIVQMTDLESVDLSKYSNIKITISQGKYKDKVFGYIPIQIIKSMMIQQGSQKTITLPVKGKRSFGFTTIKCHIKADFSQNILNSNILGSIDKDNSEISNPQFRSRENQIEEMSGIQEHSQNMQMKARNYEKVIKRELQKPNKKYRNESESHIVEKYTYLLCNQNKMRSTTQFIKQILPVPAIFSNIKLNKLNYEQYQIKLQLNEMTFNLGQQVRLSNITQRGLNVDVYGDENKIGTVHLNVLFLTMADFKGELPIYDQNQQCVGTILVCSPSISLATDDINWKQQKGKKTQLIREEMQIQKPTYSQKQFNNLIVLSIKKIVLTNLSKQLINESLDNANQLKAELFDFVKMQACGRLQLIVRVNQQTFRYNDISLRYIIDSDQTQVVQLRRKQGFTVSSWHQINNDNNVLEIELYSNHRLLCYSKSNFTAQTQATHHFTAAKTEFIYSQSAIYCRHIQLKVPQDYFQSSRLSQIISLVRKMADGQLKLADLSDDTIKSIMNSNKKIAYVEVKKLFNLIQPHFNQFLTFQKTNIETVMGEQPLNNLLITQMNAKLLRQFALLDVNNLSSIEYQEFLKIVEFFTNKTISEIQQSCDKLMNNCIGDREGRVLYPLFVAGLYIHHQSSDDDEQQIPQIQSNYTRENIKIIDDKPKVQVAKEVIVLSEQRYFIQSIEFRNLHLLNLGKIPNVILSISNKTHYSNANPEFIIEKEINLVEPIKIYHKNIGQNNTQLLAELVPLKRRSLYELDLTGKVTAKIIWGN